MSLIVCERLIMDAMTRQISIIGIMPHVQAMSFPVAIPHMAIYSEFTNGRGPTALTVRIVDVNEDREPVFSAELQIPMDDPLTVGNLALTLNNAVFPEPGEYRVQILCGGAILIERRLILVPIRPPGAEPNP